ncbi:unnamed protein product [Schistocephalus solidus]|uniref:MFS domain-containing protein n=2 Tax=Schistocephalus solidus TaxID=70667 RepID=A0A183SQF7_SCHSO|nr:unnamed protein product [Schistocephalus solidus]
MGRQEAIDNLPADPISLLTERLVAFKNAFYSWRYLAWLILLSAAWDVILIGGKRRAFGIFVSALHTEYTNSTMTELNWIGDSYAALGFFLMPFMSTLIIKMDRGYRGAILAAGILIFISCFTSAVVPSPGYLFFTHTVLHGIGSTLILSTTALITGEYFDKTHRFHVLATTFVSGGPYGVLIFGPLFSIWTHDYGWRRAFEICGILFLASNCISALVFYPKPIEMYEAFPSVENVGSRERGSENLANRALVEPTAASGRGWALCSWAHLRENWQIFLWALERLLHNFVMYGLLMNLTTYVTEALGNEIKRGSKINLYFGAGESTIFTAGALIGDRIRGYLPLTYLLGAMVAAMLLIFAQTYYKNITAVLIIGGFLGAAIGSANTFLYATAEEVMLVHGSIAFPMTKMIAGIGMSLAPLLSGLIIDRSGFRGFFISMTVLVCIRAVLLLGINIILWRKKIQRSQVAAKAAKEATETTPVQPIIITTTADGERQPCDGE